MSNLLLFEYHLQFHPEHYSQLSMCLAYTKCMHKKLVHILKDDSQLGMIRKMTLQTNVTIIFKNISIKQINLSYRL